MAQIGAHAAAQFAARLQELGLVPAHAGIMRAVASSPGISQQALASLLGIVPSRLVPLLDELEQRGLVERRDNREDRRLYALHVTAKGEKAIEKISGVARAHDDATCKALSPAERQQLHALLVRVADEQGLTPGVHPGFSRVKAAGRPGES
jgi:DNA-binding MarR family transcriptional regulator